MADRKSGGDDDAEAIVEWSRNDRCEFIITASGSLRINEQEEGPSPRTTELSAEETLDLLPFLSRMSRAGKRQRAVWRVVPMVGWSLYNHYQFVITESGALTIIEHLDGKHGRATLLSPEESSDLLFFLKAFVRDIRKRSRKQKP
jgi:hypothetical protein